VHGFLASSAILRYSSTTTASMTSYLPYDIQSLLPRGGPSVASLPAHGAPAPSLPGVRFSRPTCVAFVRHCG